MKWPTRKIREKLNTRGKKEHLKGETERWDIINQIRHPDLKTMLNFSSYPPPLLAWFSVKRALGPTLLLSFCRPVHSSHRQENSSSSFKYSVSKPLCEKGEEQVKNFGFLRLRYLAHNPCFNKSHDVIDNVQLIHL